MERISTSDFVKKYRHVNFEKMSRTEAYPNVRLRLLGLHHLINGKTRIEAAAAVGKTDEWLRLWILRYSEGGYEKLKDRPKSGHPTYLTPEQEQELVSELMRLQDEKNGGRTTAKDILEFIKLKYKVEYKKDSIYDLLERLGMSWVSSRSKHPKMDVQAQKKFKQTFKARVRNISKNINKKKDC